MLGAILLVIVLIEITVLIPFTYKLGKSQGKHEMYLRARKELKRYLENV